MTLTDPRCKIVGKMGNSLYCELGKVVPDELLAIVIVVAIGAGQPEHGSLGFDYTGFDHSLIDTGAFCGIGTTGAINLGLPARHTNTLPLLVISRTFRPLLVTYGVIVTDCL
jgi:hypothetical protein